MIKDRGRIKWTAMMLPEHVQMLRDWVKEDAYEPRVILDEQQLEEMNSTITEAMEYRQLVALTYYNNRRYHLIIGYIHYYDEQKRKLHVVDQFEQTYYVQLKDIVDVRSA